VQQDDIGSYKETVSDVVNKALFVHNIYGANMGDHSHEWNFLYLFDLDLLPVTVNDLSTKIPTPYTGMLVNISDGHTSADCTVGGGAALVTCRYNGSAWVAFGGDSYSVDQSWTGGATSNILLGSPVTLIPSTAPTGLYRVDAEIAQTSIGNCLTHPGTVSARLSYVDYNTNQAYLLSDAASNLVWLGSNASMSFTLTLPLAGTIDTSSAQYSYKVIFFKTGTVAQIQPYQVTGDNAGCSPHPSFQTTVTATRVR